MNKSLMEQHKLTRGKKRDVTVLFLDIKDYTAISEKLEPEEVHELLNRIFQPFSKIIQEQGGWLEKYIGDALMAVFGKDISHKHAERAIESALNILERLKTLNLEFSQTQIPINIRIGIATGSCLVGRRGDEEVVTGDTVNTASRLESLAPIGQIYISDATYQRVPKMYQFEEVGSIQLKGKNQAIQVHRVLGRLKQTINFQDSTYVGREENLSLLTSVYQDVQNRVRPSAIVIVQGELGYGRSRLIYEFKKQIADDKPSFVIRGEPHYYIDKSRRMTPFAHFKSFFKNYLNLQSIKHSQADVLKHFLDISESEFLKLSQKIIEFEGVINYLFELTNTEIKTPVLDSHVQHQVIIASIKALAHHQMAQNGQPFVLHLEDIDNMDRGSLGVVAALCEELEHGLPLIIILSCLPGYKLPPVVQQFKYLEYCHLKALNQKEAFQLIESMNSQLNVLLKQKVVSQAQGNPFFIEELVKSLAHQNQKLAIIPASVQDIIQTRLDFLSESTREVLKIASVIGRKVPEELLKKLIKKISPDKFKHLAAILKEAEEHNFLFPLKTAQKAYIFKHVMVYEKLYFSLLKQNSSRIHHLLAELILQLHKSHLPEHYPQLAYHYEMAGDIFSSIYYLQLTAQYLHKNQNYSDAMDIYEHILEFPLKVLHRIDVIQKQITLLQQSKDYHGALNKCVELKRVWDIIPLSQQIDINLQFAALLLEMEQYPWAIRVIEKLKKHPMPTSQYQAQLDDLLTILNENSQRPTYRNDLLEEYQKLETFLNQLDSSSTPQSVWYELSQTLRKLAGYSNSHIKVGFLNHLGNQIQYFIPENDGLTEIGQASADEGLSGMCIQNGIPQMFKQLTFLNEFDPRVDTIQGKVPDSLIVLPVVDKSHSFCVFMIFARELELDSQQFFNARYAAYLLSKYSVKLRLFSMMALESESKIIDFSNYNLLQELVEDNYSGCLAFLARDQKIKIYLKAGNIIHAEIPSLGLEGKDALYEFVVWGNHHSFSQMNQTFSSVASIEELSGPLMYRLGEHLQEYGILRKKYPHTLIPHISQTVTFKISEFLDTIDPFNLMLLKAIDGHKNLNSIQLALKINSYRFLMAIDKLYQASLIAY